jgi:dihydrofolate reductase
MKAIVAVSKNNVIGINGKLPWEYPDDLKFFREKTLDQHVVVGHKTFLNMPTLKRRHVNVLSRNYDVAFEKYLGNDISIRKKRLQHLIDNKTYFVKDSSFLYKTTWVIGGAQIYSLLSDQISDIYISRIPETISYKKTDDVAFFPDILNDFYHSNVIKRDGFHVDHYQCYKSR